jgi:acyl-CoA dehydrogenase
MSAVGTAEVVQRTRRFVRDVVIPSEPPVGERLDTQTRDRLRAGAREAGIFAPQAPQEYGGLGLPISEWPDVFQEAGYSPIGPVVLNCMAPDEGNMFLLERIGSPAQREKYLGPLSKGEQRSSFAMTEPHPGAGSDPDALTTFAVRTGRGWRISGRKRFISGADGAGFFIVMARNEAGDDYPAGATMFLVDAENPGIRVGEHIPTIDTTIEGGHPYVDFDECEVDDAAVLGAPGEGFRYAQVRLGPARLTHCMRWLGLARRAHHIALDRASHRTLFGQRLADLGIAQELIAQSVIDLEMSVAIIERTAKALEVDPRAGAALSSIAKVHCSEAIYRVIDRAIQICGGDGVSERLPLHQFLNEVRPFRIYDGSTETHKWAIARRAVSGRAREIAGGERDLDELAEPASQR